MRLEHEEQARNDEARATDDLGHPVDAVEEVLRYPVVDAWEGGEAGDPEDGGTEELGEGG